MRVKDAEYYWKKAKVCWIMAGIFFAIALIGHVLVLILTLLGYE